MLTGGPRKKTSNRHSERCSDVCCRILSGSAEDYTTLDLLGIDSFNDAQKFLHDHRRPSSTIQTGITAQRGARARYSAQSSLASSRHTRHAVVRRKPQVLEPQPNMLSIKTRAVLACDAHDAYTTDA